MVTITGMNGGSYDEKFIELPKGLRPLLTDDVTVVYLEFKN